MSKFHHRHHRAIKLLNNSWKAELAIPPPRGFYVLSPDPGASKLVVKHLTSSAV